MCEELSIELEQKMIYERQAATAIKAFHRRNIEAWYVPTRGEALAKVMEMIPEGALVGTADSITLLQVGVFSALRKRGKNEVINPFYRDKQGNLVVEGEARTEQMRRVFLSDVYVIGTNAITLDGKLVNTDAIGNRVAPMIFGPKKVIVVVGANKITKDVDEARKRIREVAAPLNATRHRVKHNYSTYGELPCVKGGACVDCTNPNRICRYTTIIEGLLERRRGALNVVIVGENLGI